MFCVWVFGVLFLVFFPKHIVRISVVATCVHSLCPLSRCLQEKSARETLCRIDGMLCRVKVSLLLSSDSKRPITYEIT